MREPIKPIRKRISIPNPFNFFKKRSRLKKLNESLALMRELDAKRDRIAPQKYASLKRFHLKKIDALSYELSNLGVDVSKWIPKKENPPETVNEPDLNKKTDLKPEKDNLVESMPVLKKPEVNPKTEFDSAIKTLMEEKKVNPHLLHERPAFSFILIKLNEAESLAKGKDTYSQLMITTLRSKLNAGHLDEFVSFRDGFIKRNDKRISELTSEIKDPRKEYFKERELIYVFKELKKMLS
ncbi:MAG: hypothetical protein JW703_00605 [Candidatus Diapherotrites archaeon]|nr:hypothetical protein [Candidatus Diapherotrites archaeon]